MGKIDSAGTRKKFAARGGGGEGGMQKEEGRMQKARCGGGQPKLRNSETYFTTVRLNFAKRLQMALGWRCSVFAISFTLEPD